MPKSSFIDFKAIKSSISMEKVLEHYGLHDRFKKTGDSLSGPCPIHKGSNPTQFRISLSKNIWNCFSECKGGGNVLDFIAKMENVTIHAAALKAIEWFDIDPGSVASVSEEKAKESTAFKKKSPAPSPKPAPAATTLPTTANKPLQFRLAKLERNHPYFSERGLFIETILDFDIGFCEKGTMAGRIAISINNREGQLVGYAGRFPGDPPGDTPKYKLPQGFKKSLELFNIDRALNEPEDVPMIIVEGFFDCMKLYQHGCRKVVALMGSTMSTAQENIIREHTDRFQRVIVLLDEDEAGRNGRADIAVRLAKFVFVKIHGFDEEDQQPEHMSAEEVAQLLN